MISVRTREGKGRFSRFMTIDELSNSRLFKIPDYERALGPWFSRK
jgi:hypothetical protein